MSQPPRQKVLDVLTAETVPPEELSAYERWILPNMEEEVVEQEFAIAIPRQPRPGKASATEPDEPVVEEVAPLTAEDVEAIRQAAYDDGFQQGKTEGYQTGKTQGHDEGYKKGYASGEQDVRQAAIRLSQICRTLVDAVNPQDDALEAALIQLVAQVCTQVVKRELKLDSSGMSQVIREAIRCITPGSARIRVHLNPVDIALVESLQKDLVTWETQWKLLPHPSITPGGCIIDTDESVVDARAEKRLGSVLQQVYDKDAQALVQDAVERDSVSQLMDEVPAFTDEPVDLDDA